MTARVDAALDAVAEERATVRDEYQALGAFDGRVAGIRTVTVPTGPPLVADPQPSGQSLERVRTAYAETVMSAPHYEAEYGDTVAESLAAEFGDGLAAALLGGTALTPELRDAVRGATDAARREREEFFDVLEPLESEPVPARRFDDLHDRWSTIRELQGRVDAVGLRRQETIRGHRTHLPGVPTDLCEYLYYDLEASYPVLADVADLGERLNRARDRVERALASTG